MKVIAFINFKGGVGKTTLSANIGTHFAKCGKKVLLIDLDPQANLTFSFISTTEWDICYRHKKTIRNLFSDYLFNHTMISLDELIIKPEKVNKEVNNNLSLISSHNSLHDTETYLAKRLLEKRKKVFKYTLPVLSILKNSILSLETSYDIIIIDCPPNFNIITKNALVACDYYVIPVKLDYFSSIGIVELKRELEELKVKYNDYAEKTRTKGKINPELLGVACNMAYYVKENELITTQRDFLEQVINYELPVFKTMIRENNATFAKNPLGVPAILGSSSDTYKIVRDELINLSNEVMDRIYER